MSAFGFPPPNDPGLQPRPPVTINPSAPGDSALVVTMPLNFTAPGITVSGPIDGTGAGNLAAFNLYGTGNGIDIKGWTPNAAGGTTNGGIPFAIHQYGTPPLGGTASRIDNCGGGVALILANTENSSNAPVTWGNGFPLQWNSYNGYTTFNTVATVTGTNTVTDTTNAPFFPNCVGKPIIVAAVKTTIASYISASQVTTTNAIVNGLNVTYSLPLQANVGQLAYMTLDPVPTSNGGGGFLRFVNVQTGLAARPADPWSFENNPANNACAALQVVQPAATNGSAALWIKNGGSGQGILVQDNAGTNKWGVLSSGQLRNYAGANEATGAGSASLGANSPAVTNTAPFTWLKVTTSDGSQGYIPVWK